MENTVQNFRSAFHGFHRDDVVRYLEDLTAQHTIEVNQLQDDLKRRTDEVATLRVVADRAASAAADAASAKEELEAKVEELTATLEEATNPETAAELETLTAENEALRARVDELEAQAAEADALRAKVAELEAQAAEQAVRDTTDWGAEELNAYRRAESVERLARTRAAQLCDRTNTLVADFTARLSGSREGVEAAAEAIGTALDGLQAALDSSRTTLEEGVSTLSDLKLDIPQG